MNGDHQKIREFEAEILDKLHLSTPLLQYDEDIIIPYLLKAYGDIERERDAFKKHGLSDMSVANELSVVLQALGHAIRWACTNDIRDSITMINSHAELDQLASQLLIWSVSYYRASIQFVAWSRGLVQATIDEVNKKISFEASSNYDYHRLLLNSVQDHERAGQLYEFSQWEDLYKEFEQWLKHVDLYDPPIVATMQWDLALNSPVLPLVLAQVKKHILPECEDATELGGYTLGNYRKFYALLSMNFDFIRWVEQLIDRIAGEEHDFGSNPIKLDWEEACRFFGEVTDLSTVVVAAIFNDLTFDHQNFHTSLMVQPVIRSRSNQFYIMPNFFSLVDANRMLIGALNKGRKKPIYDRLINQIEQYHLTSVCNTFEKFNVQIFRERTIKSVGKVMTPDLVILDKVNRIILVIEYKHSLSPFGPSEVSYRIKETDKAIRQVENYVSMIPGSNFMKELIWEQPGEFTTIGLILFNRPMAVPLPIGMTVLTSDLYTLDEQIKVTGNNLTELLKRLANLSKIGYEPEKFDLYTQEIEVADWKVVSQFYATEKLTS